MAKASGPFRSTTSSPMLTLPRAAVMPLCEYMPWLSPKGMETTCGVASRVSSTTSPATAGASRSPGHANDTSIRPSPRRLRKAMWASRLDQARSESTSCHGTSSAPGRSLRSKW